MALTKAQEAFLSDFADKGLAEIAEAEQREVDIAKSMKLEADKEAVLAEIETRYQAEKEAAIAELESKK